MLLELNFSAVAQAEKIIQEMKEKIDVCRSLEDRAVAHLEVSRELSKSLIDNGLESNNFNVYRSTLSEIWGLESTPIDVKRLATKLERTQHELASLDQEYEQLRYEKQEVESKLEMTVASNKELLLQKQELENKIRELERLTDSLDNSEQELNSYSENLLLEINDLKSQIERLTAENNFYNQENIQLKSEKLVLVTEKDRAYKERIAQLESMVVELQSANQSLEWQKDKAVAMVEEKAQQAIPVASDWKVNDIAQVIGTGETVTIVGYSSDQKQGHFVCLMPDGETKKEYFTGQLRFVQSGRSDVESESEKIVAVNSPQMSQTDPGLPLDLEEVEVVSDEVHVPSYERAHEFIKSYRVKTTRWEDFQKIAQGDPQVLVDISMSNLKNKLRVKTALPGLFGEYVWRTGKTGDLKWLNSATFDKVATNAMSKREKNEQQLELEQDLENGALEFFKIHNSPKKLGNLKWETVREYAQGNPKKIDALIGIANSSGRENSKTRFCDRLEDLCADYIKRSVTPENPQGDRSDLGWVPFANLVQIKLGEEIAIDREMSFEQLHQLTGLNPDKIKVESMDVARNIIACHIKETGDFGILDQFPGGFRAEIEYELKAVLAQSGENSAISNENLCETALSNIGDKKISDCKTVEQLEEISACNPNNIQDASDVGVIVEIYEIQLERTGKFEKLNWLPESIQDEIYQRLGRGSRPLDFEIGEKVRGSDPYSAYHSKVGIITRLTPGLISVAWESSKFNTHDAEELEIIPESLTLQAA